MRLTQWVNQIFSRNYLLLFLYYYLSNQGARVANALNCNARDDVFAPTFGDLTVIHISNR